MEQNMEERSGLIIKRQMNELGIKQIELAKAIGVSHTRLSQWMNAHDVPSDRVIRRVAEKLGLSFELLRLQAERERYERDRHQLEQRYAEVLNEASE